MKNSEHYFSPAPKSDSSPRTVTLTWAGRSFVFKTDSGVFSHGQMDKGTQLLLRSLPTSLNGRVLDLGCGWGAIGVITSALYPKTKVMMTDINPRAVSLAEHNAALNNVRAETLVSDGFAQINGLFDTILFNPPIRAGKQAVYRLFGECAQHLNTHGDLYVVIRKQQGADSAFRYLGTLFTDVSVISRSGGYRVIQCKGDQQHAI